ncbi:hypothetical protein RIR_jg32466.t1 [Rhizophagus irregularis DAOM 181602=DAOM 197198]|nr:hypothetical protein RIR_jg32466.t1 [Rhizophagus irregularis DAOM 181602=DAOM 197198]
MKNNKLVWFIKNPSTPLSKFRSLSSSLTNPVKANIKERECLVIVLIVLFSIIGKIGDEGFNKLVIENELF